MLLMSSSILQPGWDDFEWKLRKINQGQSIETETLLLPSGGEPRQWWVGRLQGYANVFIKLSFMLTEIAQQQQQKPPK